MCEYSLNEHIIKKKKMTAKAVEIGIRMVMDNNVYQFADEIQVLKEGGGIGVKLTGDLAKGVMVKWDQKFRKKLAELVGQRPAAAATYCCTSGTLTTRIM